MTSLAVLLLVSSTWGSLIDTPTQPRPHFHQIQDLHDHKQLQQSEVLFTTPDYARKYGYPIESHTVTTEDGYLLTLHRIPGSPRASASSVKTPVFLQHGLAMASDCWLLSGPGRALGFILADQGYDVWMGNARGNRYSKRHVTLPPRSAAFYNFTWHEMGMFDLPAEIDLVLKVTDHKQLLYVGHSMGCTMFFVMTSTRPEYNDKIRFMVALAPAVYLGGVHSILGVLVRVTHIIRRGFHNAGEGQIRISNFDTARVINVLCRDGNPFQEICKAVYFSIFGFNRKELNTTVLPSTITHLMSGLTTHVLHHFAQLIVTDRFQVYHQSDPVDLIQPEYDLSKVSVPVSIFYSLGDFLVPHRGVKKLSQRLRSLVKMTCHEDARWNHVDYLWGIHTRDLVYPEVLGLFTEYSHVQ